MNAAPQPGHGADEPTMPAGVFGEIYEEAEFVQPCDEPGA